MAEATIEAYDETSKTIIERLKNKNWMMILSSTPLYTCPLCGAAVAPNTRVTHIDWHESEMNVIRSLLMPYDKINKMDLG